MNESGYRCQISRISGNARAGFVLLLSAVVIGCGAVGPYQAYSGDRQDTTTLSNVNFWVGDSNGATVVSRARGSYPLPTR